MGKSTVIPSAKELEGAFTLKIVKGSTKVRVNRDIYLKLFGGWYIIPKGLETDGASVPWLLTFLIKRFDSRILLMSVWHDYGYLTQFMPRLVIDAIYSSGLAITSNRFIAVSFYWALRLGGWVAWYRHKRRGVKKFPEAMQRFQVFLHSITATEGVAHTWS